MCLKRGKPFGFDSCSARKFQEVIKTLDVPADRRKFLEACTEPCESSLFSAYINVLGEYWNCSFCEHNDKVRPVNVLAAGDFLRDVWYHPNVTEFRTRLLSSTNRSCPMYDV